MTSVNRNIFLSLVLMCTNTYASDGFEDDGFGYEDIGDEIMLEQIEDASTKPTTLSGKLSLDFHYNTKNNLDLSMSKTTVEYELAHKFKDDKKIVANVKAHKDFIYGSGVSNYTTTPEGYESGIEVGEMYLSGSIGDKIDYKLGRQINVWGKADILRSVDILNPSDNRIPGLTAVKDLKLPRVMSKVDYYADSGENYSLSLIHENRYSKTPKFGSDFRGVADAKKVIPDDSISPKGYAISVDKSMEGADASLYWSRLYADKPYYVGQVEHYDNKVSMVGLSYNKSIGEYLIKADAGFFKGIKYNIDSSTEKFDESRITVGLDYSGIKDTNITYELSRKDIDNYKPELKTLENAMVNEVDYTQALRVSRFMNNQDVELTVVAIVNGSNIDDGGILRADYKYKVDDDSKITFGVIDYINKGATLPMKDNDRVFMKYEYNF